MTRRDTFRRNVLGLVCAGVAALGVASFSSFADAAIIGFDAVLSGGSEAPQNASPATGDAKIIIDDALLTMRVQSNFSGLVAGSTVAHLHCCTAVAGSGTAAAASGLPTFAAFPAGVTSGTYDHVFDMSTAGSYNAAFITANGGTVSAAFASLLAGLKGGSAYFNIHTTQYPGGEIRGFMEAQVSSIPVSASIFALTLALASLFGLSKFRGA